jgi:outer membrane protein with beta-barrel domain
MYCSPGVSTGLVLGGSGKRGGRGVITMKRANLLASLSTRWMCRGAMVSLLLLAVTGPARAEDLKSRWYFGGNLSFLSTTDDIRSNAGIIIGPFGDDGIPFTGDPNEEQGCTGAATHVFCDPRPDDLLARADSVEETFKYDLTAGYGLTSWLSLQLDASYFRGDVGPVDVFLRDSIPAASTSDPTALNTVRRNEFVIPTQAGRLTEIPVSLTGIVRFRKDSPLNPYIGLGGGMIFSQMDRSPDVDRLNIRLTKMRIQDIRNELDDSIVTSSVGNLTADGRVPFTYPLAVNVQDAFEWHLIGGAEYFFNDRFSVVFDARYAFVDKAINLDMRGQDQINLAIFSEGLFRSNGSTKIFNSTGQAPNPLCSDSPNAPIKGASQNGCPVNPPAAQRVTCDPGAVGDFDGDGNQGGTGGPDFCYNAQIYTGTGLDGPRGYVVVQGGKIDLSGFSVAVGMRFHF